MIECDNLSYRYPQSSKPIFENISFKLKQGELILLQGESGCGKSTLLKLIFGLIPKLYGGHLSGKLEVDAKDGSRMGYVPQCSDELFLCETVEEEVLLAMHLAGLSPMQGMLRWEEMLSLFDMQHVRYRSIQSLSGGQRKKLSLILALLHQPSVLLLDEPLNQLDQVERDRFVQFVLELRRSHRLTIVVADHERQYWDEYADQIHIFEGAKDQSTWIESKPSVSNQEILVKLKNLSFQYEECSVLKALDLDIRSHQILALKGRNGSGKTTLLKILSKQLKPTNASSIVFSHAEDEKRIGYLPQSPTEFFLAPTVEDEFVLAAKLKRTPFSLTECDFWIKKFQLEDCLSKHPHDLSIGQQQRAAIAVLLSMKPKVILLDEPTHGLDMNFRSVLRNILREQACVGTAIVLATHDENFSRGISDREISL